MRILSAVSAIAALAATEACASSIVALAPSTTWPSIVTLGEAHAIDPSIVAATPAPPGATPSILRLPDVQPGHTPSIIALGEPEPAGETVAATPSGAGGPVPIVIRAGEIGPADPRPAQASAPAQQRVPLLDPNDKGTPAKRKALKRQAERLAQEKAKGATGSLQPDPGAQAPAPGS
ncbi:MAG: hypothetical protein KF810_17855 [Rhizobiaceae bacterium]|nr:hypothetical protein [Rhizobiaceae bacterium]